MNDETPDVTQLIKNALEANPEVRLVLEIASRARDAESREAPRELGASTDVTAIPSHPQCGV